MANTCDYNTCGSGLNLSLPSKPHLTRILRIVCIICFAISFPILLPYGIIHSEVVPTIAILPLFFSSLLAFWHLGIFKFTLRFGSSDRRGEYHILIAPVDNHEDDNRNGKGKDWRNVCSQPNFVVGEEKP